MFMNTRSHRRDAKCAEKFLNVTYRLNWYSNGNRSIQYPETADAEFLDD